MKKILWKSDLWLGTLTFGVIALTAYGYCLMHYLEGESGAAFASFIVGLVPMALTFVCAFTDRSEAMWRNDVLFEEPEKSVQLPTARATKNPPP